MPPSASAVGSRAVLLMPPSAIAAGSFRGGHALHSPSLTFLRPLFLLQSSSVCPRIAGRVGATERAVAGDGRPGAEHRGVQRGGRSV